MSTVVDPEARDRAAFRAFVRRHHPDVGGDPELFAAGLASFDRRGEARSTASRDRYDAPVVVVSNPTGLRGLIHRLWSRRLRKHRPPRVM